MLGIKQETKLFRCETYYVHIQNDAGKYNEYKFILGVYLVYISQGIGAECFISCVKVLCKFRFEWIIAGSFLLTASFNMYRYEKNVL